MTARNLLVALCLTSALAAPGWAQSPSTPSAPPPAKKPVKSVDDLPRHTYQIPGKASEFLNSDAPFKELLAKVKADTLADLAAYDISDKATLQGYYGSLQMIAVFEGRWDDALGYIEQIKAVEAKESKKLMVGQSLRALAAATKATGDQTAKDKVFKDTLRANVSALPWDLVRDDVSAAKARAEMVSAEMINGMVQGQVDPVVEQQKGQISGDIARQLIAMRVTRDIQMPSQHLVAEVYGAMIAANTAEKKDIWTPRQATLTDKDHASPVVICIWDSGVDIKPFAGQLYVNPKEQPNGKDDDGNGFVDDINGIAFDLENKPTTDLLHPIKDLRGDLSLVESHTKGMSDLQASINTPEAEALRKYVTGLKADQVKPFMEDLSLYGNYSHGTHVAGIAAAGNPFARLLPCRLTFDFREIPLLTPNEELSKATAKMYMDSVAYMKAAGVRVVNMSWGNSKAEMEHALEQKGVGKSAAERAEIARKLFAIERDGLEAAIKSAPGILFVAAAGNSDNDNQFADVIPSGFTLPNLLTVGAVDQTGKPTGFTTFGKNVKVYANGFEVESYVPGGKRLKYSGTSMASPNITNLAAKLIALKPSLTPEQTIDLIVKGSDPMEGRSELLVANPKASVGLATK
ncbi:MAG: S8 family serine peptidase [Planctomycetes bacterium]|nr:S8 family serine peptidase [Planctomycetota bacterium]